MSAAPPPSVLIILPTLESGGAERLNVDLARALRARGIRADICLVERMAGPLLEEARAAGIKVLDATTSRPRLENWRNRRILWLIAVAVGVFRLAWHSRRYDVVMTGLDFMPVLYAWAGGMIVRRPLVAQSHCMVAQMALEYRQIQEALPLLRWAYRRVGQLIGVSAAVVESACSTLSIPAERASVIANGIDFVRIETLATQAPSVKLPDDEIPFVVSVGMLRPEKNQALLIRAHAKALEQGPAHRIVLLGEGKMRAELERLAEELGVAGSVLLPGATENPFSVMRRAALLCLSSDHEGSPLVLLEALALGCPIVSTRCSPEVAATLGHGEFGQLVDPGDVDQLSEAIVAHLRHPDEIRKRALAAVEGVRAKNSIEAAAVAYARVIEEAMARHGQHR